MTNRLANESSPYLLQHAENPVDWYPWCDEALERARVEDKPIFLSIGYSACHWCHVMEHESFENAAIAKLLNENFVNIKVDREERPDLDHIYMNAMMALRGGGGGWPLSVFLTPSQDIFFGGTYWPPQSRVGMPGFDHVILSVLDAFTQRRDEVTQQSKKVTEWLNESMANVDSANQALTSDLILEAAQQLERSFDATHGGFGGAPKFPHAMDLLLLVRLMRLDWQEQIRGSEGVDSESLLNVVQVTLKKMAYGGIFDHLGGGFARYSVDEVWLVPHFEKMLYDNALLAKLYVEMLELTGKEFYRSISRKTLDYCLNYLHNDAGGFFSTEDADSEGEEGKFYVWSRQEILQLLGEETGERFCRIYNVTESGNFEGHNILNMTQSYVEFSESEGISKPELREQMKAARETLLRARDQRIRPGLDDKILVSWNGLAISAMARASVVMDEPKYRVAAERAAEFIIENVRRDDGRLLHTWRKGKAKLDAYLDDYSYFLVGLIDLYEATFENRWLAYADTLANQMIQHFGDEQAFFFTADDQEQLITRTKAFQDSSVPSGNAMAATALLRLGRIVGNTEWIEKARGTIAAAAPLMKRSPLASGQMLFALADYLGDARQTVLVAEDRATLDRLLMHARRVVKRGTLIGVVQNTDHAGQPNPVADWLSDKACIDRQPTMYVCENYSCSQPVVGGDAIMSQMNDG